LDSNQIFVTEPPDIIFRKPNVPNYKYQSDQNRRFDEGSKMLVESYFWMKRKNKTDNYREEIEQQISERQHYDFFLLKYILKYFIGTQRNPKHSPSSFPKCL
jgi:hypothetical protein